MRNFSAFLTLFLVLALPAFGNDPITALAHSKEWLRLLHYETHFMHGPRSAVDGSGFFLTPSGKEDPEAEMRATLAAFHDSSRLLGKLRQTPACAFPARFRFLNERLKLGLKNPTCEKFSEFIDRFHPNGVALVFSAAYPNNPASMFGHTFLRIIRKDQKGDLLDQALGYAAAVPPEENDFAFIWFGVTGGYPGQLSTVPYYAKVNEYSNSESRDLWEYELDINADQTWWLLANAWEIETNSYLDYFFFDENCSWLMLTMLEVARPDWTLSDFSFDVVPGETIKRVTRIPGAVRSVHFRPSLFKKMRQAVESLSGDSLTRYKSLMAGSLAPAAVNDAPALNAVMARLSYEKQKGAVTNEKYQLFRQTLLARAKLKEPEPFRLSPIPETTRPDLGHDSARAGIAGGGDFLEAHWKSGYHDLFNSDIGYAPFSEISFPGLTVRYNKTTKNFFVSEIEGLSIQSHPSVTEAVTPLSWKARITYERLRDFGCKECRGVRAEGGVGFSFVSRNEENAIWSLLGVRNEGSRHFARAVRGLASGEIGAGKSWNHLQKTVLIGRFLPRIYGAEETEALLEASLVHTIQFSPLWEIRAIGDLTRSLEPHRSSVSETKMQLNRYF